MGRTMLDIIMMIIVVIAKGIIRFVRQEDRILSHVSEREKDMMLMANNEAIGYRKRMYHV